jgi:hypothetical protein
MPTAGTSFKTSTPPSTPNPHHQKPTHPNTHTTRTTSAPAAPPPSCSARSQRRGRGRAAAAGHRRVAAGPQQAHARAGAGARSLRLQHPLQRAAAGGGRAQRGRRPGQRRGCVAAGPRCSGAWRLFCAAGQALLCRAARPRCASRARHTARRQASLAAAAVGQAVLRPRLWTRPSRLSLPCPSSPPPAPRALAGEYNCFLNVIIQCLWHCDELKRQVGGGRRRWSPWGLGRCTGLGAPGGPTSRHSAATLPHPSPRWPLAPAGSGCPAVQPAAPDCCPQPLAPSRSSSSTPTPTLPPTPWWARCSTSSRCAPPSPCPPARQPASPLASQQAFLCACPRYRPTDY